MWRDRLKNHLSTAVLNPGNACSVKLVNPHSEPLLFWCDGPGIWKIRLSHPWYLSFCRYMSLHDAPCESLPTTAFCPASESLNLSSRTRPSSVSLCRFKQAYLLLLTEQWTPIIRQRCTSNIPNRI